MEYTYEYFNENYTLHQLKTMIFDLGSQPKTKNKRQLIEEIIMIKTGQLVPPKKSKRGRPAKHARAEMGFSQPYQTILNDHQSEFKYGDTFCGVLEPDEKGDAFIHVNDYSFSPSDVVIANAQIKALGLLAGDKVEGIVQFDQQCGLCTVKEVTKINGVNVENFNRIEFDKLLASYPSRKVFDFDKSLNKSLKLMDVFAPMGFGQRGLICQPKELRSNDFVCKLAKEIAKCHPDTHIMGLFVDERPEEVGAFSSGVESEVITLTFDKQSAHQVKVCELFISHAKRLVETGGDVVLFISPITKLARLYNYSAGEDMQTISQETINNIKRIFALARTTNKGSLSVIATFQADENNFKLFDELVDASNMEIHLMGTKTKSEFDCANSYTLGDERLSGEVVSAFAEKMRRKLKNGETQLSELQDVSEDASCANDIVKAFD